MTAIIIAPKVIADARGWFSETYHQLRFADLGIDVDFRQDNHSHSKKAGIIRGLHYQRPPFAQAKLVRCIRGRIWDVAVDIRRGSPTYGKWVGAELSAENHRQLFIPAGYLHGFVTLENDCEVTYKVSAYYDHASDGGIRWNDPDIGIEWPIAGTPQLSEKDAALPALADLDSPFDYDGKPLLPLEIA